MTNVQQLNNFLRWAEKYIQKNKLSLEGFWTYDNDFFSKGYLNFLLENQIIILNKDMGKEIDPDSINMSDYIYNEEEYQRRYGKQKTKKIPLSDLMDVDELKKIVPKKAEINKDNAEEILKEDRFMREKIAKMNSAAWYYKGSGRIFDHETDLSKFKITLDILSGKSKQYQVYADWSGTYFLKFLTWLGKKQSEKVFNINGLYSLRQFLKKEKPRGAVISCVVSDENCPIFDLHLEPMLELFDYEGIDYLKLLYVIKTVNGKKDNTIKFVVAYAK
jgi:hypothetical protein